MGNKASSYPSTEPIPVWQRPNFPPIIAVYDNIYLNFEPGNIGWKYDPETLFRVFEGFNVSKIVSIGSTSEIEDRNCWSSNVGDSFQNTTTPAVAIYWPSDGLNDDLLIDANLMGYPYYSRPNLIPLVPNRCVVLRGDIRCKLPDGSHSPDYFVITAR